MSAALLGLCACELAQRVRWVDLFQGCVKGCLGGCGRGLGRMARPLRRGLDKMRGKGKVEQKEEVYMNCKI